MIYSRLPLSKKTPPVFLSELGINLLSVGNISVSRVLRELPQRVDEWLLISPGSRFCERTVEVSATSFIDAVISVPVWRL